MTGHTIGRYAIEAKLGEGGMGVVFKARDPQLGRTVAIKVLSADAITDADRRSRFVREAKAASALNHPNIVTIYDIGSDGSTDFIVMEYVAGTTLGERIQGHGLPMKQAIAIAVAIADAMARAHEAGIIHRDLKPSNIIVTDAGAVKILDFGIAKLLESAESVNDATTLAGTMTGTVVGTPAYMSPEQAEGRPVDARSDIFSFGSVLYEMVTGRQAFQGQSRLSVLAKILNDEPETPGRLMPAISSEIEKTILRCLRKDPARRYQTMADLKVALEDVGDEISRGTDRPAASPVRRSRWSLAIAAIVPLLLLAAYLVWRTEQAPQGPEALTAVPLTALSGHVDNPTLSPDGNHVAFTWDGAAQDNPDIYVQQIGAGAPLRLTTDPNNDFGPRWSPDGRAIAFLRRQAGSTHHELRVIAPLGGPERKLADIQPGGAVYRPMAVAWCPDSSCVVFTDGQGEGKGDALFVVALDGSAKRQITSPPARAAVDADPAISPDGHSLVFRRDFTAFSGELYRQPLTATLTPDGEPTRLTDIKVLATGPAWLPNSREIVFSARGGLWRLDAFSGSTPTRLPFVGIDGSSPEISRTPANGRSRLVYARRFSDTNVWRVDTAGDGLPAAAAPRLAVASTRADLQPALSPDGTRLAFFSSRSGEFELWVSDPDGSNAIQLSALNSIPGFARWSPDGQTLAFHGDPEGHPDVITVPSSGGKLRVRMEGPLGGAFPSFSRDGRWIYFVGQNPEGQLRVFKIGVSEGTPIKVTDTAGDVPIESYDGRDLFYVEAADRSSALWRQPLADGGASSKMLDGVVNGAYAVVERGIYFVGRASGQAGGFFTDRQGGTMQLRYFDFSTGKITVVADNLGTLALGLTASRDGRTVFFARVDSAANEIMLVENFR